MINLRNLFFKNFIFVIGNCKFDLTRIFLSSNTLIITIIITDSIPISNKS